MLHTGAGGYWQDVVPGERSARQWRARCCRASQDCCNPGTSIILGFPCVHFERSLCVCVCDYYQLKRLFGSPLAMCVHSGSIEDPPVSTLWSCLLNSNTDKQHLPGTWPSRPLHRCLPTLSQSRCTWPPPPALPPSLWECVFSSAGAGARPLSNMLACADKSGRQR